MMNILTRIFEDKLIEDHRSPAFSFDLYEYHVAFLAPNYLFFVQILVVSFSAQSATRAFCYSLPNSPRI